MAHRILASPEVFIQLTAYRPLEELHQRGVSRLNQGPSAKETGDRQAGDRRGQ